MTFHATFEGCLYSMEYFEPFLEVLGRIGDEGWFELWGNGDDRGITVDNMEKTYNYKGVTGGYTDIENLRDEIQSIIERNAEQERLDYLDIESEEEEQYWEEHSHY